MQSPSAFLLVLLALQLAPSLAWNRSLKKADVLALAENATRSECRVESGFDYPGNDIGSVKAREASECCDHCLERSDCRAWSWTDFAGGTCWLKSGRGSISKNTRAKSGSVAAYMSADTCSLEHGIEYAGNDIISVNRDKAEDCCAVCEQIMGCRAFTFTKLDGGTCWLKSGKGPLLINSEAISAQPYVEDPTCGLEVNVVYVGNDIGSAPATDARDCCTLCEGFGGCRAFSWTEGKGQGTCHFKNRVDDVAVDLKFQSGQVLANPPAPSCALETGVDFMGNNIGQARSASAYGCCSICMLRDNCGAFSWSDHDGGTCWLKSGKGTVVVNKVVSSAIV